METKDEKYKVQMNTTKAKIALCEDLLVMLFGIGATLWFLWVIVRCILRILGTHIFSERLLYGGIAVGGVLFLATIILACLVNGLRTYARFRVLPITIFISATAIGFISKKSKHVVPSSEILHILNRKHSIILVWNINDTPITFSFFKSYFGAKGLAELNERFKDFVQYTDNPSQIKQIGKSLRLDDLFRKNRYEFQLDKISMRNNTND